LILHDNVCLDQYNLLVFSNVLKLHSSIFEKHDHDTKSMSNKRPHFIWEKVYITPSTIQGGLLHPLNYKTGYSTLWTFQKRSNNPLKWFWWWFCYIDVVLSFSFLLISVESLKNYSKSQKNHKMENSILLDSAWVDLNSKNIIWYYLVQSFYYIFKSMLFL